MRMAKDVWRCIESCYVRRTAGCGWNAREGMLRFLGWLFGFFFMVSLGLAAGAVYIIWDVSKDLPDYKQLASWEPPVMTRMHAADGSLLAEYAQERRLYVPINLVPQRVIQAYVSAEDKNFYTHAGLDWHGIGKAVLRFAQVKLTGHARCLVPPPSPSRWPRTFC